MKHTLHVIGWLGLKTAYLDLPLEEAKRRYAADNPGEVDDDMITTFQFDNEFGCYDAWMEETRLPGK